MRRVERCWRFWLSTFLLRFESRGFHVALIIRRGIKKFTAGMHLPGIYGGPESVK
jgi:hypothetical protein